MLDIAACAAAKAEAGKGEGLDRKVCPERRGTELSLPLNEGLAGEEACEASEGEEWVRGPPVGICPAN